MLRWLALLLLIPLADALLLVVFAGIFGWPEVVLLVVLTALVGMLLVRAEGRHTLRAIQRSAAQGEVPTDHLVDGGLLLVAGAFLLTPGLVTDALGFLLVIPPSRWAIRKLLKRFVLAPYVDARTGGFASGRVYTFGFPGDSDAGGTGGPDGGSGRGGGRPSDDDTVDLGPDDFDVEVEDDPDRRS